MNSVKAESFVEKIELKSKLNSPNLVKLFDDILELEVIFYRCSSDFIYGTKSMWISLFKMS